jgi:hypothetical protein
MRATWMMAAVVMVGGGLVAAPAEAKTCKDSLSAKSTSRIQGSDAAREQRARDNAIKKWSNLARSTYGWSYRFWLRSDEQKVECDRTAKSKRCTVAAKPCSLI